MTSYGFKLLKTELVEGNGRKAQDFAGTAFLDRVSSDIAASIERSIALMAVHDEKDSLGPVSQQHSGESTKVTSIVSNEDVIDEGEATSLKKTRKPPAVVRFEAVIPYKSALLLRLQYGLVGDHEKAVDPTGKTNDTDLTKLATTRPYRAVLITPITGNTAFLAVEVISRSHVGGELPRRLYQAAQGHKYKLRPRGPVADAHAVKKLMTEGQIKEVQLIKTAFLSDSGSPITRDMVMTFKFKGSGAENENMLKVVRNWVKFKRNAADKKAIKPADEAKSLASILWKDAAALEFDDARIKIENIHQSKTLQPLDFKEGFVYDLGEARMSDEKFFQEVALAAQSLFDVEQMEMSPDWLLPVVQDEEIDTVRVQEPLLDLVS